jgi:hypothetical protein
MASSSDEYGYDTEGSSCTLEEMDESLNKVFKGKQFTDAFNRLKRKMEFDSGFDIQSNNYTLEQLSRDISKTEQSKEHKDLMNILKREVMKKYPHKIKL